ncbi:MAG: DUF1579 domain-containing protein [Gemmatales bacterium]
MCSRAILCCAVVVAWAGVSSSQQPPSASPEHALLKKYAGNWDCTMKMMGQEMKCSHSVEMVGDFWAVGKFNGDFGGMKFEGRDTNGYDAKTKKYVGTWIDSMSPHAMHLTGTFDAATKTMTLEGKGMNMENKETNYKEVIVWKGDDEYTMTMHEQKDGKWEVGFSIDYKRKK